MLKNINEITGGLFAGMISSTFVSGYLFPVAAAFTVLIIGHFIRRWLHKKYPIKGANTIT